MDKAQQPDDHPDQIGFVCVHNRARDDYEVALALDEAGLLARLVTDFYCPDGLALPGPLGRRSRSGLPSAKTRSSLWSALLQYGGQALRRPMHKVFVASDRALARAAMREARRQNAGLYAYSSYFDGAPDLAPGCPVIDFEYHPHPGLALEILARDHALYPQVSWSFSREQEVATSETLTNSWQFADAVVCASSMTRKALIHAGCPDSRITIIPYGAQASPRIAAVRPAGSCRFLFVGQGVQRKGLHHLAEAWRRAAPINAQLTVISYLIDPGIAAQLNQAGITVLGRQDRQALDGLFRSADVFVMPSLVEGFGLVYLEALAAGCHVIGTHNTGLPDLPLTDLSATILDAGDIDGLIGAIQRLTAAKAGNSLDPAAIQAEGTAWTWADFRREIGAHAARTIQQAAGRSRGASG